MKSLVADALELCSSRFHYHRVRMKVSAIPEDLKIEARGVQIAQVLLNLLNNSFDAVEHLEDRWISIDVAETPDAVELSVTDSGKGVPAEIREKIMQPFFTTKEIGKGTGLGLSISKGIVDSHSGQFFLDAACANTRFVVRLPKRGAKTDGGVRQAG